MAEIINLNKARKAKLKQSQRLQAEDNRVVFGISTKARKTQTKQRERDERQLEQHRLNSPENNKNS